MCQLGRKLKEKLDFISEDTSITKEEVLDIIHMAIEEDITIEDAILDCYIPQFDDIIDIEDVMDRYDSWKDEQLLSNMERGE